MGFSRQEYWSRLPCPSPVDHMLSELSTITHPSWVALHSMAHSFIELDKAMVHVISLISFLWLWFSFPLMDKDKSGRDWLRGKLSLLMGGAMLSKSLIQFSIDGWDCVPSLLFDLRPNYGGGNEDNGDLLQKVPCTHCTPRPRPCTRPLLTHISAGGSWTLTGKSGSVWWWTGKPGVLQSMGSQGVRHDWVTELKWPFPLSLITLFTSHLPSAAAVFLLCPSWYFSSIL